MKNTITKKIILGISVFVLFFSIISFISPIKARAQLAVTDPLTETETTLSSLEDTVTAYATTGEELQDTVLNKIATAIAKQLLMQITQSVITWINSGFNGNPSFIQNPAAFFENVGDQLTGQFISQNGALSSLCSPFSLQVRLSIALQAQLNDGHSTGANQYTCTLSTIINNTTNAVNNAGVSASVQGFLSGNFNQGGFSAFAALTTQPQNNPNGAYLVAEDNLQAKISAQTAQKQNQLAQGQGFLSWETCTPDSSSDNSDDGSENGDDIENGGSNSSSNSSPSAGDVDDPDESSNLTTATNPAYETDDTIDSSNTGGSSNGSSAQTPTTVTPTNSAYESGDVIPAGLTGSVINSVSASDVDNPDQSSLSNSNTATAAATNNSPSAADVDNPDESISNTTSNTANNSGPSAADVDDPYTSSVSNTASTNNSPSAADVDNPDESVSPSTDNSTDEQVDETDEGAGDDSDPYGTAEEDDPTQNCSIQTPGSVISATLNKHLAVPTENLELANSINDIINAAFSELIVIALQKGLTSVSQTTNGASYLQSAINSANSQSFAQSKQQLITSLTPYLSTEKTIDQNYNESLGLVLAASSTIAEAESCYQALPSQTTSTISTTAPVGSYAYSYGNMEGQITNLKNDSLSLPTLAQTIISDGGNASSTDYQFQTLYNQAESATTVSELSAPSQTLSNLSQNGELPSQASVQSSQSVLTNTETTIQPIQAQANTVLQECQSFSLESTTSSTTASTSNLSGYSYIQ